MPNEIKVRIDEKLLKAVRAGRADLQLSVAVVTRSVTDPKHPSRWTIDDLLDLWKPIAQAVEEWLRIRGRNEHIKAALAAADWRGLAPAVVEFPDGTAREFAVATLRIELV